VQPALCSPARDFLVSGGPTGALSMTKPREACLHVAGRFSAMTLRLLCTTTSYTTHEASCSFVSLPGTKVGCVTANVCYANACTCNDHLCPCVRSFVSFLHVAAVCLRLLTLG